MRRLMAAVTATKPLTGRRAVRLRDLEPYAFFRTDQRINPAFFDHFQEAFERPDFMLEHRAAVQVFKIKAAKRRARILSPDGVERRYVRGKETTAEMKTLFRTNIWDLTKGLDTPAKLSLFKAEFIAEWCDQNQGRGLRSTSAQSALESVESSRDASLGPAAGGSYRLMNEPGPDGSPKTRVNRRGLKTCPILQQTVGRNRFNRARTRRSAPARSAMPHP